MTNSAKYWCFTAYSPEYRDLLDGHEDINFLIVGREICPSTGREHFQGYVQFKARKTMKQCKLLLGRTTHMEVAKGTPEVNIQYCSKDGDVAQVGEPLHITQGKRNDIELLHDTIKRGSTLGECIENHFGLFLKYPKSIGNAIHHYQGKRSWIMDVKVYWGDSGTGKTRKAFETYPDAYWKDSGPWWDFYEGQMDVIWDEFSGSSTSLTTFLRLTDRYPLNVPIKGGYRNFVAKTIVFTSNINPEEWYEFRNDELRTAFFRRITEIKEFKRE